MPPFCVSSTSSSSVQPPIPPYYQHLLESLKWWKERLDYETQALVFWEKTLNEYENKLGWWEEEIRQCSTTEQGGRIWEQYEQNKQQIVAIREHILLLQEQKVLDEEKEASIQQQVEYYRSVYGRREP